MYSGIDTLWVLLGAALVFFMQAGFAMVETGFTRAKNAGNIIMKNLMDFSIGSCAFFLIGFGLMFGDGNGFIGTIDLFISDTYDFGTLPTWAFVIFQTVFCATAATIVSGAMAERTKFSSYIIYSLLIALVVYPVSGHWIWGGGWLSELGFHDFAGSTCVHMVGGVAALVGAKFLGARIGKYDKDGKAKAIPGHSLTLGALGVFILWFAWFGFNGCSTVSMTGDDNIIAAATIFMTTNISTAAATVVVMIITWVRYGKPDVSMTLNGSLAGLVAITAGCDAVTPMGAMFIGIIAGFVVVFGIEFIEKVCKIDDPVGAIGVHGMCGAVGTILVGVFATDGGLIYGGGFAYLGIQTLGVVSVAAYVAIVMTIIFAAIKYTVGLRVTPEEEIAGLDKFEHGIESAYADFASFDSAAVAVASDSAVAEKAVPTEAKADGAEKITKVTVVTKETSWPILKSALETLDITGMTITKVMGCGMQRGGNTFYRGAKVDSVLLPKIKVEIVICKVPTEKLIETINTALHSGNIGDGKIFVEEMADVVKISTGEAGYYALQDEVM
ncbi:MAG: ammonium transporter [Bacillota bacterium]